MFKAFNIIPANLKLFDEGAAASAGAAAPAGDGTMTGNAVGGQQQTGKGEGPAKVVYGKQETTSTEPSPNTQGQETSVQLTPEERQAQYQKFKTDFKDLYDAEVQGHIKNRLGKYKGLEAQYAQVTPLVDMLHEIYQTKDIPTLMEKIQENSLERLADEAGMTVEQYKEVMKLRMENKRLAAEKMSQEEEQRINQRVKAWYDEAEQVKQEYPDFDLQEWAQNDHFMRLLKAGVSVKAAYEVVNIDNIKAVTARAAETNVAKNIQARGNRPSENGTTKTPGVIIKNDVSKLTRQDRAEIARRVAMGEEIRF